MNIRGIRFRTQDNLVILQVCVPDHRSFSYQADATWRDAKVEDLLDVADFCKTDTSSMYESLNMQLNRLREDIFERLAPVQRRYERPLTDEERYQIDASNQHQARDE